MRQFSNAVHVFGGRAASAKQGGGVPGGALRPPPPTRPPAVPAATAMRSDALAASQTICFRNSKSWPLELFWLLYLYCQIYLLRVRVLRVSPQAGQRSERIASWGLGPSFQKTVFPDAATERRVAVIPRIYMKSAAIHRIPSIPNGHPANCHGHVAPMAQRAPSKRAQHAARHDIECPQTHCARERTARRYKLELTDAARRSMWNGGSGGPITSGSPGGCSDGKAVHRAVGRHLLRGGSLQGRDGMRQCADVYIWSGGGMDRS
jgi:hypothetical protein